VEIQLHEFLTSALDGGEWSTSRPGRFPISIEQELGVNQRRSGRSVDCRLPGQHCRTSLQMIHS